MPDTAMQKGPVLAERFKQVCEEHDVNLATAMGTAPASTFCTYSSLVAGVERQSAGDVELAERLIQRWSYSMALRDNHVLAKSVEEGLRSRGICDMQTPFRGIDGIEDYTCQKLLGEIEQGVPLAVEMGRHLVKKWMQATASGRADSSPSGKNSQAA